MEEKMLLPELRFVGFNDKWEFIPFPEIIHKSNQGVNTTTEKVKYSKQGITVIRSTNIGNNTIDFENVKFVDNETFSRLSTNTKPKKGDILYCNIGSDLGSAAMFNLDEDVLINWNVFRIQPNLKMVDPNLLVQYLNWIKPNVRKYATESTMPFISSKAFKFIKVPLCGLYEQQKIASFLTSVDKRIQLLQTKKEKLEEYKKGIMQKIFSQEIRFKPALSEAEGDENGNPFPDWEEKKLGDVCNYIRSGRDKPDGGQEYWVYGSTGVIGKTDSPSYSGSFILAARVGANAGLLNLVSGDFGVSDNTLVVNLKEGFDNYFVMMLLKKYNLNRMVFGSGQPLITGGQLKSLRLKFPCFLEQLRIANFFSSIDDGIEKVNQQIEGSKEFKKGLLQNMFV